MFRKAFIILVLIGLMTNIASAATNNTNPFSPGNAKVAWDKLDTDTQNQYSFIFGLFWLIIGSFMFVCMGGAGASYSAHKSGQFADPEKKAGGAIGIVSIIFVAFGLVLCIRIILPIFGF
jgi:hypothetical protein